MSSTALGNRVVGTSHPEEAAAEEWSILSLFSRNPAKLAEVRSPGLCAETQFVLLLG